MTKRADPDQLAFSDAKWSGIALFAKAGHNQAQQDMGLIIASHIFIYFCEKIRLEI